MGKNQGFPQDLPPHKVVVDLHLQDLTHQVDLDPIQVKAKDIQVDQEVQTHHMEVHLVKQDTLMDQVVQLEDPQVVHQVDQ